MDAVRSAHRNEYPVSEDLPGMPREMLEMICQFLHARDIVQLSRVNKAVHESLGNRISAIGIRGIGASLSERRAEEAFAMLGSFCQWLGSACQSLLVDEKLHVWRSAQELAGHACFSQTQQDEAYRCLYFWACPTSEEPTDELLRLVQDVRAAWFCTCFPVGGIFANANPCRSFAFVASCLERRPYRETQDTDAAMALIPSRRVAWFGAGIEAIRLHENLAECSTRLSMLASRLAAAFDDTPLFFRITLSLDLIECIKRFPPHERTALLAHVEPLIHVADAEEKCAYEAAVHSIQDSLHPAPHARADECVVM